MVGKDGRSGKKLQNEHVQLDNMGTCWNMSEYVGSGTHRRNDCGEDATSNQSMKTIAARGDGS
jgi:hypothetical protein